MKKLSQNQWIAVSAAIAVVIIFIIYGYLHGFINPKPNMTLSNENANEEASSTPVNSLAVKDVIIGAGAEAKAGDLVTVNYVGTFPDGTKFDSSYDHGQPFSFTLGAGQVIKGWDLGVAGMKEGGKRDLIIPPDLGYGANAVGPIPGNSTLHFEVELLKVQSK